MAANTYECMLLLDPNKVAGDVATTSGQIHTILERHKAEVLASRQWDERRLAYPVNGHKKGLYYLTYFKTEGKNLVEIEHDFALNETILRTLVLKIDPKLVDTMLALARDENALALKSVPDLEGEEDDHRRGRDDDDRRRGRRSDGPPPREG